MGVGDLTVPKRMQAFGEAFYGRAAAYDLALAAGEEPLAQALCKNILNGEGIENARRLAVYAEAAIACWPELDEATFAGRIVEISRAGLIGRAASSSNEQNEEHDRPRGSLERSRRRGANTGHRIASRHRSRSGRRATRWPRSRACAKFCRRALRSIVTPKSGGPRPCRGPGPGADRADLRRHARSDRERYRRGDRSDFRAARANSANWPIWSTRRPKATPKFRIRRSRSKMASSIWAGWRPMRCSWRSILIRASRTRFSSR